MAGDGVDVAGSVADGGEEVKVNRGLEGGGALVTLEHVEDEAGMGRGEGWIGRLQNLPR
jgi:hypothetical protein